MSNDEEF